MAKCPECGSVLEEIRYPGDCQLNRDQWESRIAGNYFCLYCPSNDRGRKKLCYWFESEVVKS